MTTGQRLSEIVAAIAQLSPAERRLLQRHLRAAGLAMQDDFVTDKHRLRIAPALGLELVGRGRKQAAATRTVQKTPAHSHDRTATSEAELTQAEDAHDRASHQALAEPIEIIFDGGSRGNPGQGYGSYALRWPGAQEQIVRLRFGEQVTNNEAEYDTLIAALESVLKKLREQEITAASAQVEVRGDSALVINQVNGEWAAKEPRMRARRDRVRTLLEQFGDWQVLYHPRARNVQTLGH